MNKENIRGREKQGIQYEIMLDKNNGPYLAKDIAHDNYKSLNLLGKDAQNSHKSFVNTINLITRESDSQSNNKATLIQAESFLQNYSFCSKHLQKLKEEVRVCAAMKKQLKQDLQCLKDNIQSQASQLQLAALPALKNLREKIKNNKVQQTATYSKLKRELDHIDQSFELVGKGIKQCDLKLNSSQTIFGKVQSKLISE